MGVHVTANQVGCLLVVDAGQHPAEPDTDGL